MVKTRITDEGAIEEKGTGLSVEVETRFSQPFLGAINNTSSGRSFIAAGSNVAIFSGSDDGQIIIAVGGQPSIVADSQFIVFSATGSLPNARVITSQNGVVLTDGGPGQALTASIDDSVVATISGSTFSGITSHVAGLSGSLTRLTDGTSYITGEGSVTVTSSSNGQIIISGSNDAPVSAQYITLSTNSTLTNERVLTAGTGIKLADAGPGLTATLAVNDSVVATVSGSTFSGVTSHVAGLSGSLTRLTNGKSLIEAGNNVTVVTGSSGNITISSTAPTKQVFYHAGGSAALGNYRVQAIATNGTFNFNFFVPHDFTALVGANLVAIPAAGAAATARNIDLFSSFATIGEVRTTHTFSDTTSTYDLSGKTDTLVEFNLASLLTGLAANDYVGIRVLHNAVGGNINYLGIRLRYT